MQKLNCIYEYFLLWIFSRIWASNIWLSLILFAAKKHTKGVIEMFRCGNIKDVLQHIFSLHCFLNNNNIATWERRISTKMKQILQIFAFSFRIFLKKENVFISFLMYDCINTRNAFFQTSIDSIKEKRHSIRLIAICISAFLFIYLFFVHFLRQKCINISISSLLALQIKLLLLN